MSDQRIPVTVLAATGSVGQRFIQLLDGHPLFRVTAVTGSERSAGGLYGVVCRWILAGDMPEWARDLTVLPTIPASVQTSLVFSALPTDVAREIEPELAQRGVLVCSNASAHRMWPDVPILLPEVNPEHTGLIDVQRHARGWQGGIVTNPNCTSTGLTIALKALGDAFGVARVFAVSMQALSGAGYPGVPSLDILDNVIPYIGGEEDKLETEPRKMLGRLAGEQIDLAPITFSVHTNRVAVQDGHMVAATIGLSEKASPQQVRECLRAFQAPEIAQGLPSTPQPVILVREEPDRPQPRLDRMTGKGMTTVVGRIREDAMLDVRMMILSHNTIRGAAGGAIYNAELLHRQGYLG